MSSEKLHNPFMSHEYQIIVKLHPHQMNSDLYMHLKHNIEKRVVGKCNNVGLITKVEKLLKYDDNEINIEDFSADAEYSVDYVATICIPMKDTEVILQVKKTICELGNYLISASNGALTCVLAVKNNTHFLSMKNSKVYISNYDKYLEIGDFIKVLIINKRSDPGDHVIQIIGKIVDLSSEDEVKNNYYSMDVKEDVDEVKESTIFNDDIVEEEKEEATKSIYTDI